MRVVHETEGERRALATTVDLADSFISQTVGLMGQSTLADDYALVFEFGDPGFLYRLRETVPRRVIHMLFVRLPLDVLWLRDDEVVKVATLSPWTGIGVAKADTIVELPAGSADGVDVGDTVVVEREESPDDPADTDAAAEPDTDDTGTADTDESAATGDGTAAPADGTGDAATAEDEPAADEQS
ncbi:hypothetical protein BV210_05730 [Halorientalis sp. IM1011]|uniref:DUF192 domain-containing protein n=1 Tax=Halorientalis sp. IM1011 TaxID=1932360 RepID=UPI00097CD5CB|nr:hypothetical protein BV210_05730 [Halorientalis sp. IM1011]